MGCGSINRAWGVAVSIVHGVWQYQSCMGWGSINRVWGVAASIVHGVGNNYDATKKQRIKMQMSFFYIPLVFPQGCQRAQLQTQTLVCCH